MNGTASGGTVAWNHNSCVHRAIIILYIYFLAWNFACVTSLLDCTCIYCGNCLIPARERRVVRTCWRDVWEIDVCTALLILSTTAAATEILLYMHVCILALVHCVYYATAAAGVSGRHIFAHTEAHITLCIDCHRMVFGSSAGDGGMQRNKVLLRIMTAPFCDTQINYCHLQRKNQIMKIPQSAKWQPLH